jgi:hypothetical protein
LQGDALGAEQGPQPLVADVVDHPLGHQELGQPIQAPGGERQVMPGRLGLGDLLISRRCLRVNFGGWPPLYFGYSDPNPSALKLRITSRTRSSPVNATLAIAGTSMPGADSSTICARRRCSIGVRRISSPCVLQAWRRGRLGTGTGAERASALGPPTYRRTHHPRAGAMTVPASFRR